MMMDCDPSSTHRACVDSASVSSRMRAGRSTLPNQRLRQGRHLFHTCTAMLATLTFAGAIHHAAFVNRIGHGRSLTSLPKSGGRVQASSPGQGSLEFKHSHSMMVRTGRFSSLWMAPRSSDTELQGQDASSSIEDEDEWRTVLAAFQMYKAAYGDLKVPSRFVVPGMAPWPGECS